MNRLSYALALTIAAFAGCVASLAQEKPQTPHRTRVGAGVEGASIMLDYGQPETRDPKTGESRKGWAEAVPVNKVWPLGGGDAARLSSDKPLVIGRTPIDAGTNSLFALIAEDGSAKLIVSSQTTPGAAFDPAQELARVDMQKETLGTTTDRFTMVIVMNPGGGATLKIIWQNTQYSVPLYVRR